MARNNNNATTEQITAICKSNQAPEQKERLLLSIGLSTFDARVLAFFSKSDSDSEQTPVNLWALSQTELYNRLRYTCGVEIECFALNRDIVANSANYGLSCNIESYNHTDHAHSFKLVSDGSLGGLPNSTECVSPVLTYSEANDKIYRICQALNDSNARVNKTCGLHVHVGAENLSDSEYCNVFVNYMYLFELINSFLAPSRRESRWAKDLAEYENRVLDAQTKNEMGAIFGCDRYFCVNACAYSRHHTIEFRQHQGTTDHTKIMAWLNFCVKLVEYSKTNRLTAATAPQTIDQIEFLSDSEKLYFKQRAAYFRAIETTEIAA